MAVTAALNFTKPLLGDVSLGEIAGGVLNDLSGRVICITAASYLVLKLAEKQFALDKFTNLRRFLFSTSLVAFPRAMFNASFAQRCSGISQDWKCLLFSDLKQASLIAAGLSVIYFVYKYTSTLTWKTDKYDVMVFTDFPPEKLRYRISNLETKKTHEGLIESQEDDIEIDGKRTAGQMRYLRECEVVVGNSGAPFFARPLGKWTLDKYEVGLIRAEDGFLWQLSIKAQSVFDLLGSRKMQVKINPETTFLYRGGWESKRLIHNLDKLTEEERASFCKGIRLVHVNVRGREDNESWKAKKFHFCYDDYIIVREPKRGRIKLVPKSCRSDLSCGPFGVVFEPIYTESCIDGRVLVSQFYWGITLITRKGKKGNHAKVVVEGIESGKYFMYHSHFTGAIIKGKDLEPPYDIKYSSRSPVWKTEWRAAKKLLASLKKQDRTSPPFCKLGSTSIINLPGYDNCFTWLKKELTRAYIFLDSFCFDIIAALPRNHTYAKKEFESTAHPEYNDRDWHDSWEEDENAKI